MDGKPVYLILVCICYLNEEFNVTLKEFQEETTLYWKICENSTEELKSYFQETSLKNCNNKFTNDSQFNEEVPKIYKTNEDNSNNAVNTNNSYKETNEDFKHNKNENIYYQNKSNKFGNNNNYYNNNNKLNNPSSNSKNGITLANYYKNNFNIVFTVFLILLYSLTVIVSIVGNVLVIIVMSCGFRSSFLDISIYLVNLGIFNLLMSLFCIPFTFVNALLKRWIFQRFMCRFTSFIQLLSVNGCIITLTILAINRYHAVAHPLKYNSEKTKNHIRKSLIFTWIISIALSSIQLFIYECNCSTILEEQETTLSPSSVASLPAHMLTAAAAAASPTLLENNNKISKSQNSSSYSIESYDLISNKNIFINQTYCVCGETWDSDEYKIPKYYLAYTLWIFMQTYCIPVLIIIVTYSKIISILWYRNCNKQYFQEVICNQSENEQLKLRTIKVIRMLCVVIASFLINWLPIHIFHLYLAIVYYNNNLTKVKDENGETLSVLFFFCHWLSMSNSFINPIIYSFMNNKFKNDLYHLLHCNKFTKKKKNIGLYLKNVNNLSEQNKLNQNNNNNNNNINKNDENDDSNFNLKLAKRKNSSLIRKSSFNDNNNNNKSKESCISKKSLLIYRSSNNQNQNKVVVSKNTFC